MRNIRGYEKISWEYEGVTKWNLFNWGSGQAIFTSATTGFFWSPYLEIQLHSSSSFKRSRICITGLKSICQWRFDWRTTSFLGQSQEHFLFRNSIISGPTPQTLHLGLSQASHGDEVLLKLTVTTNITKDNFHHWQQTFSLVRRAGIFYGLHLKNLHPFHRTSSSSRQPFPPPPQLSMTLWRILIGDLMVNPGSARLPG